MGVLIERERELAAKTIFADYYVVCCGQARYPNANTRGTCDKMRAAILTSWACRRFTGEDVEGWDKVEHIVGQIEWITFSWHSRLIK